MAGRAHELIVIPDSFWRRPEVTGALRSRNMGRFFALVQQYTGASQTQIGIAIGWSQSKVSDVERGVSEVKHLAVFEQIADGLKLPDSARAALGLAPREPAHLPAAVINGQLSAGGEARDLWEAGRDSPAPSAPDSIHGMVRESTMEAAGLVMSAGKELIDPLSIEQSFEEVRRILVDYTSATGADLQVLQRATALRGSLQKLTAAYQKPSQSSDLYLATGLLSGICSYVCLDLGYAEEAMTQARAAFMMGDLAGHDGLRAWSLGTRALIARFQEHYPEALRYVRQGLQYATTGTALVRLRCGEGQTLAHMGDAANAIHSLDLAKEARGHVSEPDIINGIFTFTEAKQAYYAGSSLQWLSGGRNAKAAESESMQAIRMFQESRAGTRSLADELLAHVYLSNSRITLGEIDGSMEALRPVLDLPLSDRSAWHRKRLRQIALRLGRDDLSRSRLAISAREEISAFIEVPKQ